MTVFLVCDSVTVNSGAQSFRNFDSDNPVAAHSPHREVTLCEGTDRDGFVRQTDARGSGSYVSGCCGGRPGVKRFWLSRDQDRHAAVGLDDWDAQLFQQHVGLVQAFAFLAV
jgi:hypothetical protein